MGEDAREADGGHRTTGAACPARRGTGALVPEFVPVLGPIDDVVIAVLVLRYVRRRIGAEGLRTRWRCTPEGFELLRSVMG